MSVETELRDQIIAGVETVESRVYPVVLPKDAVFPAIRYNRISTIRGYTLNGRDCFPAARFQVDVFADKYTTVQAAWGLLRIALDGFSSVEIEYITLDNETEDFDDELKLYRVIGDFVVQYKES